jgi:hypothetical protein
MTKRPSYDIDANTHGSAPLQSGIANIVVCKDALPITASARLQRNERPNMPRGQPFVCH